MEEDGESLVDSAVLASAGSALHIVIVAIADYEVEAKRLACATASAQLLEQFWIDSARAASHFLPNFPVASVSTLHVAADQEGRFERLMRRLKACLRLVRNDDLVVVHWIGHGEIDPATDTQFLLLPCQLRAGGGVLERAAMPSVVDWFANECRARRHYFFFDCCSTVGSPKQHDEWAVQQVAVDPRLAQLIYIGSGLDRAALARRSGPTLFAESFIQALSMHPEDMRGRVFVGGNLVESLAGGILQRLVLGNLPLPDEYDLEHDLWRDSVIRIESPRTLKHRAVGRFLLGTAQAAHVGACILTKPSGPNRFPVHHDPSNLTFFSYRGSIDIEAFVGNATAGVRFKLKFGAGTPSEMVIESAEMMLPFVQDWKSA